MLGATREIYRGFVLDYWRKPVPTSDYDWGWTHVDYDGAPDAFDNRAGYAPTRRAALLCIDEWHEEDFLNREECDEHVWGHGDPRGHPHPAVTFDGIDNASKESSA